MTDTDMPPEVPPPADASPDPPPDAAPPEPPRPLQHLTDDELEHRLASLAGHLAATEAELLAHVLELDVRGLWGRLGMRSAAQYLSWRLGYRLGAARERVRVAYALLQLPAVAAAFAEGQLSYCKVRALTRVATPVNEAELLEVALGCTGAQLERVVRAFRNGLTAEQSASATLRRGVQRRVEDDGSVVYLLRVPPDEAAVVDNALALARRVVLDDARRVVEVPEETRLAAELTADPPVVRAEADAFVLLAESFVAGGAAGHRGDGMEVLLHADLDDLRSVPQDPPARQPADGYETDLRPAGTRSVDGQPLLPQTALRRMCEASVRVMAHAPDGRPIDLGRTVRDATPRQRRVLHERDRGCRFPGCTQRRRLVPHHVQWWSRGGPTDLDNLVLLCPAHHRAVHEVGYRVTAQGAGRFAFATPGGRRLMESGRLADPPAGDAVVDIRTPYLPLPTWGGEHLDLRLLVDAMVANTLIGSGRSLPDLPLSEIPRLLRETIGWPLSPGWPRPAAEGAPGPEPAAA